MTHYDQERENEIIIERFKMVESVFPILDVTFDDKSISIADLVKLANQLASALNDRGCYFQVKK